MIQRVRLQLCTLPPFTPSHVSSPAHERHLLLPHPPAVNRRAGYPFGTLVDFAADGGGLPIFCLSPLAIHARNLIEDPRCSLVVQMPGWTGLANARVTIFGDVYQLPADMQVCVQQVYRCTAAWMDEDRYYVLCCVSNLV